MILLRKSGERRHVKTSSQDTWMSFDPESPYDPMRHGFRALESLNEEHPGPAMGLLGPPPRELDVVTYVQAGMMLYQDAPSRLDPIQAGEFQHTHGGEGIVYRSINPSPFVSATVFQSCFSPATHDLSPMRELLRVPEDEEGVLRLVASGDGRGETLRLHEDVLIYSALLRPGQTIHHALDHGRGAWVQVVAGQILLGDRPLATGDGAAIDQEPAVRITARTNSELLLFDLA